MFGKSGLLDSQKPLEALGDVVARVTGYPTYHLPKHCDT